jgi:hypothetical protein
MFSEEVCECSVVVTKHIVKFFGRAPVLRQPVLPKSLCPHQPGPSLEHRDDLTFYKISEEYMDNLWAMGNSYDRWCGMRMQHNVISATLRRMEKYSGFLIAIGGTSHQYL